SAVVLGGGILVLRIFRRSPSHAVTTARRLIRIGLYFFFRELLLFFDRLAAILQRHDDPVLHTILDEFGRHRHLGHDGWIGAVLDQRFDDVRAIESGGQYQCCLAVRGFLGIDAGAVLNKRVNRFRASRLGRKHQGGYTDRGSGVWVVSGFNQ